MLKRPTYMGQILLCCVLTLCGCESRWWHCTSHSCGTCSYDSSGRGLLVYNGLCQLDGGVAGRDVQVNGNLHATHATIGTLTVNGAAQLDDCLINGTTNINGSVKADGSIFSQDVVVHGLLHAKKCQLRGMLSVSAEQVTLSDTHARAIQVRKITGDRKQTVFLKAGAVVDGDIVFEGGNGTVAAQNGCTVHGTICGGTLVQFN